MWAPKPRSDVEDGIRRLRPRIEALLPESPDDGARGPGGRGRQRVLDVPFVSQLELNRAGQEEGFNNCGPACVTMAVLYNRIAAPSPALMHRIAEEIRDQPWWAGTYTTFQQMLATAREFRVPCRVVGGWQGVRDALDRGQPVLLLVHNSHLRPPQVPLTPGWFGNHFIIVRGYDEDRDVYYVCDPLRFYHPRGPGEYTRASVERGADAVGGVQALAIDRLPPQAEEMSDVVIHIRDEDLKRYLEQAGQAVNMDTAIIKRACLAYRRGETRGPAISGEYEATSPSGKRVIRQKFTAGIAECDPDTFEVGWVEVVTHPDAIQD